MAASITGLCNRFRFATVRVLKGLGDFCSMPKVLMLVVLLVGACAFNKFNELLPKFVDQPIDSLVAQLGLPNAEQTIMGRKVYTWRSDMSYTSITPVSTTSTGYVGTRMVPVTVNSTSYVPATSNLACTIRAVVGANGRIESVEYEGNNGACLSYSSRLKAPNVSAPTPPPRVDPGAQFMRDDPGGPQFMCRLPGYAELQRVPNVKSCTYNGGVVVKGP